LHHAPSGENAEPNRCIYTEQVGTQEVRFVRMHAKGQLLRFTVDSNRCDNDARLRETRFPETDTAAGQHLKL